MNRAKVRIRNPFASQEYECLEEQFAEVGTPIVFFASHKGMKKLVKILASREEFEVVLQPFTDRKYMCEVIFYKGKYIYLKGVD